MKAKISSAVVQPAVAPDDRYLIVAVQAAGLVSRGFRAFEHGTGRRRGTLAILVIAKEVGAGQQQGCHYAGGYCAFGGHRAHINTTSSARTITHIHQGSRLVMLHSSSRLK